MIISNPQIRGILAAVLLLFLLPDSETAAIPFPEVVHIVKGAVVKVSSKRENRFGSGFFVDSTGHFVTCAHVLKNDTAKSYENEFLIEYYSDVYDKSGNKETRLSTMSASVDTIVEEFDFAILSANLREAALLKVSYLPIGNSDRAEEGEEIATCGFIPDRFAVPRPIVVKGIVSVIRENEYDPKLRNEVDILQLDQQTAGGLSGAPVFSVARGVIGYMDASILPDLRTKQSGFSYALAINQVKSILRMYNIYEPLK